MTKKSTKETITPQLEALARTIEVQKIAFEIDFEKDPGEAIQRAEERYVIPLRPDAWPPNLSNMIIAGRKTDYQNKLFKIAGGQNASKDELRRAAEEIKTQAAAEREEKLDRTIYGSAVQILLEAEGYSGEDLQKMKSAIYSSLDQSTLPQLEDAINIYFAQDFAISALDSGRLNDGALGENREQNLLRLFRQYSAFYDQYEQENETTEGLMIAFLLGCVTGEFETRPSIKRITAKTPKNFLLAVDKVNNATTLNKGLWNYLADKDGQYSFRFDTAPKGKTALVYCALNFDAVEGTKGLLQFDRRVYEAAGALWNTGAEVFSVSQVYKAMGGQSNPKKGILEKVNASLTKMGSTRLTLDNQDEIDKNFDYKKFSYDSPLLPFERCSVFINGQFTDSAIHLFREPPLLSFAKERNQVAQIPIEVLQTPVSMTEGNLQIQYYLLHRIERMKNRRSSATRKILYSTLFEQCGMASGDPGNKKEAEKVKKQKQRTKDTVRRILDHFIKTEYINGYVEGKDSITIDINLKLPVK